MLACSFLYWTKSLPVCFLSRFFPKFWRGQNNFPLARFLRDNFSCSVGFWSEIHVWVRVSGSVLHTPPNFSGSIPHPWYFWSIFGVTKSRPLCQVFLVETVEIVTYKKNLELFQNVSVHEFYRLKALITLGQVNTNECSKKVRILISKIAMIGCKLSLYANESCDEHAIYFRRRLKWSVM